MSDDPQWRELGVAVVVPKCKCDSEVRGCCNWTCGQPSVGVQQGARAKDREGGRAGGDCVSEVRKTRIERGKVRKVQAWMQRYSRATCRRIESNPNRIGWDGRSSFLQKQMACGLSIAG